MVHDVITSVECHQVSLEHDQCLVVETWASVGSAEIFGRAWIIGGDAREMVVALVRTTRVLNDEFRVDDGVLPHGL